MISKNNKSLKRNESSEEKEFLKFYKIDLKTEKEVMKMADKQRKQYMNRLKRWESLIETQIDFEIFKSKELFDYTNRAIDATKRGIKDIRADPEFEDKHELKYKQKLVKIESDLKEVEKQIESDRLIFDSICGSIQKNKDIEDVEDNDDIEYTDGKENKVKTEELDEMLDSKELVKREIKEEYDSKLGIKREIKTEIKSEIKQEFDIKPIFKTEVKTESDIDLNKVKTEYLSTDEEEDY